MHNNPKVLTLVLATLHLIHKVLSSEIDNSLLGVPEIDCKTETIEMRFGRGVALLVGPLLQSDCIVDYSQATADGNPVGGIKLHHGSCDMDRQRMVQPEGMQFSTILVISFHPTFVTKTDRAFHINCMYREAVKAVSAGLTVSPLPTVTVAYDMPMPVCDYTIRKDNLDGPVLRYAKVGDQVVHRWQCKSEMYGMLVHSCYVEDGQGEKRMVIDERGCHIDQIVLGDPTYTEDLNLAYRESYVFKFADRVGVRFSCEIKLCVKDGGCSSIVPPNCGADYQKDLDMPNVSSYNNTESNNDDPIPGKILSKNVFKRHSSNHPEHKQHSNISTKVVPITATADLISQYVYVLDTVDDPEGAVGHADRMQERDNLLASSPSMSAPSYRTPICLSSGMFAGVLLTVALAFAFATLLILHVLFKQHFRPKAEPKDGSTSSISSRRASPMSLIFK
uniref:ZP domain-containing protein n=1 Tax=Ditylenchus dipsaci TaxID=166011 RepID=A0A915DC67_9BILA